MQRAWGQEGPDCRAWLVWLCWEARECGAGRGCRLPDGAAGPAGGFCSRLGAPGSPSWL